MSREGPDPRKICEKSKATNKHFFKANSSESVVTQYLFTYFAH